MPRERSTPKERSCHLCGLISVDVRPGLYRDEKGVMAVDRCADHVGCELRREKLGVDSWA